MPCHRNLKSAQLPSLSYNYSKRKLKFQKFAAAANICKGNEMKSNVNEKISKWTLKNPTTGTFGKINKKVEKICNEICRKKNFSYAGLWL